MKRAVKAAPRKKYAHPSVARKGVKLSLYLPAELVEEARTVAGQHERTVSWVVARAVRQMLDRARVEAGGAA